MSVDTFNFKPINNGRPLGKQVMPVQIGKFKNGDIGIQTEDGYVRIPAKYVMDVPGAIMLAAASGEVGVATEKTISKCKACGTEIEFNGKYWYHTKINPRHIAVPCEFTKGSKQ